MALMLFGCYSLISIGWHLVTLSDCHEAEKEIRVQMNTATNDLSKKGYEFKSLEEDEADSK